MATFHPFIYTIQIIFIVGSVDDDDDDGWKHENINNRTVLYLAVRCHQVWVEAQKPQMIWVKSELINLNE